MSHIQYNERIFLNPPESHYTGSVICVDGLNILNQGKLLDRYTFVEISDCHGKVRLHKDANLPMKEFIRKLRLFAFELNAFANFLENNS